MTTTTAAAATHTHAPHITVKTLYVIYGALLGLMFLTLGAAYLDLGLANFPVAMGIATAKMGLIIVYFMHVRYSSTLVRVFSCAALFWLVILVIGMLNDYYTRGYLNVPGK
jgi:cytochrome c oxidase subunit IV